MQNVCDIRNLLTIVKFRNTSKKQVHANEVADKDTF